MVRVNVIIFRSTLFRLRGNVMILNGINVYDCTRVAGFGGVITTGIRFPAPIAGNAYVFSY